MGTDSVFSQKASLTFAVLSGMTPALRSHIPSMTNEIFAVFSGSNETHSDGAKDEKIEFGKYTRRYSWIRKDGT